MALTKPQKKRLHQQIIKQKLANQSKVLAQQKQCTLANKIKALEKTVASGDPDNIEAQAAKLYFQGIYREGFNRKQDRFYNSAMNYCYAVIRSAIARSIFCHGLLPIFGLFHNNEQNAFNLADDLMEPFRPCVDSWILHYFPNEIEGGLNRESKRKLVGFLHTDIKTFTNQRYSVLAMTQALVMSLIRVFNGKDQKLLMPVIDDYKRGMNRIDKRKERLSAF